MVRVFAGRSQCELMHLQLTEQDSTRIRKSLGDGGIVVRHEIAHYL